MCTHTYTHTRSACVSPWKPSSTANYHHHHVSSRLHTKKGGRGLFGFGASPSLYDQHFTVFSGGILPRAATGIALLAGRHLHTHDTHTYSQGVLRTRRDGQGRLERAGRRHDAPPPSLPFPSRTARVYPSSHPSPSSATYLVRRHFALYPSAPPLPTRPQARRPRASGARSS